jgi:hypothetical protein
MTLIIISHERRIPCNKRMRPTAAIKCNISKWRP